MKPSWGEKEQWKKNQTKKLTKPPWNRIGAAKVWHETTDLYAKCVGFGWPWCFGGEIGYCDLVVCICGELWCEKISQKKSDVKTLMFVLLWCHVPWCLWDKWIELVLVSFFIMGVFFGYEKIWGQKRVKKARLCIWSQNCGRNNCETWQTKSDSGKMCKHCNETNAAY